MVIPHGEKVYETSDASRLVVGGSVNHPAHPCVYNRSGAHGTGLESDIKGAVVKPPGADFLCPVGDCRNFGMAEGIAARLPCVFASCDYFPVPHEHGADRHLALGGSLFRKGESRFHESLVNFFVGNHSITLSPTA